jgi:hypothetical protein
VLALGQPAYEVAHLGFAAERFEKLIPRSPTWPTDFARVIASESLRAGGLAISVASAMLEKLPQRAEAVRGIARLVQEAQNIMVPYARAIGAALGAGQATVSLPTMRSDAIRLLWTTATAWRELARLRAEEPLFTKLDTSGKAQIARATAEMEKLGARLYETPIPAFPETPSRQDNTATKKPTSWSKLLALAIIVGIGTLGVVGLRKISRYG